MVFWMLNLVMAYEDESKIMTQVFTDIGITFKTWNIVDASISLVMLPFFILISAIIEKYEIKRFRDLADGHRAKIAVFGLLVFLKIVWIFVGLSFFAKFKFVETSNMLMQFAIVYFVGFVGGSIFIAQFSIKKRIIDTCMAEYE